MPSQVLIVPDKFKGTLTATAAAAAIDHGWRQARPRDILRCLPMSDGGDGFGEILSQRLQANPQSTPTVDAAHRPLVARWWWAPKTRTAIIESAKVIGLAWLPPHQFHPFDLDTFGLGAVLEAAARKGARRCLIGIGGSATNDAGFGLARALGWTFWDRDGEPIDRWTRLNALARLQPPQKRRLFTTTIVAVDVQNPLLGPQGCSRIYGPQKGLRPEDFLHAEQCLRRLAFVAGRSEWPHRAAQPGAGAAGGLGYGLSVFLGAQLKSGFDMFARHARLSQQLRSADLVITGEGALDQSTLMGKGVGEVALQCRRWQVPCIGVAGLAQDRAQLQKRFSQIHAISPDLTSAENSQAEPARWLAILTRRIAAAFPDR